ncbi:hypothetical protein N1031_20250 [Herbiconiux moechotypicola]|uniref:Uncharacterized protein n=1 Tax=Herbiconiux moechotypicola TaxID=637393 RepID=A0ABN3E8H7_9MICO|nr:hypothetical protein [Herbiconiux moechotypicola]MCS5732094.1 hypothetical protein [Herbiconiux moechotypicola]
MPQRQPLFVIGLWVDYRRMLYIARGIEDDHFWVVRELDGVLVETPWRVEPEHDGYRLSHADDSGLTARVFAVGSFATAEAAVDALRAFL